MIPKIGSMQFVWVPQGFDTSQRGRRASLEAAGSALPLTDLLTRLTGLRRSLVRLERSGGLSPAKKKSSVLGTASASSGSPLNMRTFSTATRLRSTEEINATPTSFTPFGPSFGGSSTALPTLDGIYNGDQGSTTLTFEAKKNAVVGVNTVSINVLDNGQLIETLNFGNSPADTEMTLSNGLKLSLSAGTLDKNDTFQVQVFDNVGSVVDPNLPFNGTRNLNPNLQYGFSVNAGTFDLNGETIAVLGNDTIQTVLDRINGSAAGVTGSFDAATETLVFDHDTPGSAGSIDFSNDTSGFLDAMKISGASAVTGLDDERFVPIAQVLALSSIQTGTFRINGVQLSVDVNADSLDDVLQRINASAAGATASFDAGSKVVKLQSTTTGADLVLDNETSDFFDVLQITPGTYAAPSSGSGRRRGVRFSRERLFRSDLGEVARALRSVYAVPLEGAVGERALGVRSSLKNTLVQAFESLTGTPASADEEQEPLRLKTQLGFDFDFVHPEGDVLDVDRRELARALKRSTRDLQQMLFGEGTSQKGLVEALRNEVERLEKEIATEVAQGRPLGSQLDVVI